MKSIRLPVTVVALAIVLAACGSTANQIAHRQASGLTTAARPAPADENAARSSAERPGIAQGGPTVSDRILQAQGDQRVIQDATVELRIKPGSFDEVYGRAISIAEAQGGYLLSSHAGSPGDDVIQTGTLVVRVLADRYLKVLDEYRKLGSVQQIQTSSQDVSDEFVDLQARLRNQQAQQAVLLDLMRRAQTIQESIAVQNQLSQVTQEIERIEGRIRFLNSRTSFSTITLNLMVPAASTQPRHPNLWEQSGLGDAVNTALRMSTNVLSGMIIVLGFLLPFAVLVGIGAATWRFLPRRALPTAR